MNYEAVAWAFIEMYASALPTMNVVKNESQLQAIVRGQECPRYGI